MRNDYHLLQMFAFSCHSGILSLNKQQMRNESTTLEKKVSNGYKYKTCSHILKISETLLLCSYLQIFRCTHTRSDWGKCSTSFWLDKKGYNAGRGCVIHTHRVLVFATQKIHIRLSMIWYNRMFTTTTTTTTTYAMVYIR